jgi:L-threonylcarbamoyladenylate synthase
MKIIQENKKNIKEIVAALKNGAVLVLPTDTVYGLICDAGNEKAVDKIFEIKKRDKSKPLPVFVGGIKMAEEYAIINAEQNKFLEKNWPGAVTVVLEGKKGLSSLVYKNDTIALRQPDYKLIIDIIKLFDKPLAQTSANISGEQATTKIKEILKQFDREDVLIIDNGDLPENKPSKIVDLTEGEARVVRC